MNNHTSIKELRPEYRPDEKFLALGPEALSDAELLAIILRSGSSEESSVDLADRILHSEKGGTSSLLSIFEHEVEDLMKLRGVGKVKAVQIKAVAELSKRIAMTQASGELSFTNPQTIADYYMEQLRHCRQERIILILLDSACHRIKDLVLSVGTVNSTLYSPREILIEAVRCEAVSVILLHNHPSGNPTPSSDDIQATRRVRDACSLVGIQLIDHIIIGDRVYFSFCEEEMLEKQ